ncbi:MAG: tRNA uridine-5-carboxymethylaminomethyl(34) synthesis GTPase MnmE [bacterium]
MRAPALPRDGDTIAAVSTPCGVGGIGIVRITGPDAERVGRALFRPRKPLESLRSRHFHYGHILDPVEGGTIDEVLLVLMRAPATYTREDVVEIHCHGGPLPVRRILEAALSLGVRLADPGEFTRRAFLNGRIDLAQAEAVLDTVNAKTETALRFAQNQLSGNLSREILRIREDARALLVEIEAWLDFPEEDLPSPSFGVVRERLEGLISSLQTLLGTYSEGRLHRDGATLVIGGGPNVGKSTLLNAFLGEERAIVSPVPGTTRDYLEELALLEGLPVRLVDTAGLRDAREEIEAQGVERARRKIAAADLFLCLVDASAFEVRDWAGVPPEGDAARTLLVVNKCDLATTERLETILGAVRPFPAVCVSARYGHGMDGLRKAIADRLLRKEADLDSRAVVTNLRHQQSLQRCVDALREAEIQAARQAPLGDVLASDLRRAVRALGEIVGETTPEEILRRIFDAFCIGK